mgnify:CR=1 FL=1
MKVLSQSAAHLLRHVIVLHEAIELVHGVAELLSFGVERGRSPAHLANHVRPDEAARKHQQHRDELLRRVKGRVSHATSGHPLVDHKASTGQFSG